MKKHLERLLLAAALAPAASASAATIAWFTEPPTKGNWQDSNNWDPLALPATTDHVGINNGGTAVFDPDNVSGIPGAVNPVKTVQILRMSIAESASSESGNFEIHSGTIETLDGEFRVGERGTGTGLQTGGTIRVLRDGQDFRISGETGGVGTWTMSGGLIETGRWQARPEVTYGFSPLNDGTVDGDAYPRGPEHGGDFYMARRGGGGETSTLNISGGQIRVSEYFYMADSAGGTATINMTGGNIFVGRNLPTHDGAGDSTAVINVSGGEFWVDRDLQLNNGDVGSTPEGSATLNLSGTGMVKAGDIMVVGQGGPATVNQTGGSLVVGATNVGIDHYPDLTVNPEVPANRIYNDKALLIARSEDVNSTYNLSGGSLESRRLISVGHNGNGTFNQTGGAVTIKAGGTIGAGSFRQAEDDDEAWDTVTWKSTGGDLLIAGDADDGLDVTKSGSVDPTGLYKISGGSLTTDGSVFVGLHGPGTLHVVGGGATIDIGNGFSDAGGAKEGGLYLGKDPLGIYPLADGAGKIVAEITGAAHSTIKVDGNIPLGAGTSFQLVPTAIPATGTLTWKILQADADDDGSGALTGTFATTQIPNTDPGGRTWFTRYQGDAFVVGLGSFGDMNGDGSVDNLDIAPFALALTDPTAYSAQFPNLVADVLGDISNDGAFDNLDISPFATLLTGGSAAAVPEPSTLALAGAGLTGVLIAARRRRQ